MRRRGSRLRSAAPLNSLYNGLLAGFHLNETSGNPVDFVGIAATNIGVTQGVTGKFGNAINGNNSYISLNTNSLIGGLSQFTIAAWTKYQSSPGGSLLGSYGGNRMYAFAQNTYNQWIGNIYIGTTLYQRSFLPPSGVNWVTANVWYLTIFEWTGTVFKLTVNTDECTNPLTTPAGTIQKGTTETIGASWYGYPGSDRIIDEVLYWNRPLTTEEKTNLWNGGSGIIL